MSFDTLTYSKRLKAAGFTDVQAETLAEVSREMLADEMVTKSFLQASLDGQAAVLRAEMKEMEMRLTLRMRGIAIAVVAALAAIIKL